MFISFGMFIGLILLTLIMIALIIYLTFTSGKNTNLRHIKTQQAEEAAKERLANNNDPSQLSIHSEHDTSNQQNDFIQESEAIDTSEDDHSLHVLPYPKDNKFQ